ncbi:unnamed protein product [Ceutorhynchus assimilis]|uniref:acid phosphatase n=1 Tax=Ceutorhynchus assimilis TaxID=467358 RepID=A0A9N9QH49_9CUCU|nr:unnamed protein product [Ceutorhynchus assimilis]
MPKFFLPFLTTLLVIFAFPLCSCSPSDLDAVVVIFRHGDRTPIRPYENDPYKNRSYWPVDWGMLTNVGKLRHYDLGQYFRQRYLDFLPTIYSEKDIYVRSTDVDRTLMSAEANLAGLYPPVNTDIWKTGLAWQPIPIHSIPEKLDAVLAAKKPCKKYDILLKKLFQNEYFRNVSHVNRDLYAYLTKYAGESIDNIRHLEYLYNTLTIETLNNYTLPNWTKTVFPSKMQKWAELSFATDTYTTELARLKTGPFFNELIKYFTNRTVTPKGARYHAPRFVINSAHDTTIANLLNSIGAFEYHCPPYTATIIFELHKPTDNTSYINIFYKNTSEAVPIKLRNCENNCDLKWFQNILSPISLNLDQWETECNSLILFDNPLNLYILLCALLGAMGGIIGLIFIVRKNAQKSNASMYTQLPDEEYA